MLVLPYHPPFSDYSFRIFFPFPLLNFDLLSVPLSKAAMLLPLSYAFVFFRFIEPPFDITPGFPYTACYGPGPNLPNVLLP